MTSEGDSQDNFSQNCINNLLQGSLWQSVQAKYENKVVFPIILYFDDFECGNPLGSHAGIYKLGAVYYTIASIPPEYSSRLENIFLALLFHSSDKSVFGNRAIFNPLINELKFLQDTGITVYLDNKTIQVYFEVILIVGDNLGLHSIFGYVESFSATHFCRFCITSKIVTKEQCVEYEDSIKLQDNYRNHLETLSFGIKEDCVWHDLKNFHVYDNWACDVMHDLYEGVHRYDMALIIKNLIAKNYFSLECLNSKIKYFLYESSEKNKPPKIKKEHLNNECIIMSASEMLCLVNNFRFIIGDLIPSDDSIWNFYLKLLQITDILISDCISVQTIELLKCLITEHHEIYVSLFKRSLKPKHNFLLHYPRIMLKVGPLIKLSCLRFEAKHKVLKSNANNVSTRRNLPYTLAFRMQLKILTRLMSSVGLCDVIDFGKIEYSNFMEHNTINDDIQLTHSIVLNDSITTKWYSINGIKYNISDVIMVGYDNEEPQFGEIRNIFVNKENPHLCYFVFNFLKIINFNLHYRAYKVILSSQMDIIFIKDIVSNSPTIIHSIGTEKFISISKIN